MPLNAAQLMVNIGGNPAGALTAISAVSGELGKGGKLGIAALGVGAIVAGVGIASVAMAGNFQKGMTSIVTGAGESQDKLKMLSDGVLQMARDTGTSTSQLVSGLYMIESGGYRGSKALEILRNAAEGAKVGNADLGTVADATDTILKNFGDKGLTAAQAVNTLISTVAHGKTHMEDLAASLSQVLPTASAAGIGLNDVMGAMATMTGEGVPAAEAATYLRQTMIALSAPAAGAKKALEEVGLTSKQVATAMETNMPQAMQMITNAVAKKFPAGAAIFNAEMVKVHKGTETFDQAMSNVASHGGADYIGAMRNIAGGSKQMQGILDLSGAHVKTFADNVKTVADAAKHGGNQITGWNLVQKTFNLQFDRAKEVAQTLMIQLGQKLLPVATQLFGFIADKAIPALQHFAEFVSGNSAGSVAFKIALIAVSGAIAGALVAAFVSWAIAAGTAAIATLAATWPILAIGAGIALLIAGIILLVTHWKQVTVALGHFKDMLGDAMGKIGEFFGNVFGKIGEFFGNIFGKIGEFFTHIADFVQKAELKFGELELKAIAHVKQMIGDILGKIGSFIGDVLGKIGKFVGDVIGHFIDMEKRAIERVKSFATGAVQHAKDLAKNFIDALTGLPGKLLSLGENLLKQFAQGLRNGRSAVMDAVKNIPVLGGIAGSINNLIPKFAAGGTMTQSGLALVGENEPEIVRLPAGAQVTPMSRLPSGSGGFGAGSGGSGTIVVQVHLDGRVVARSVARHLPSVIRNATGERSI